MAHELRTVITLLNGYKQNKEDFPFTGENYMEFKFYFILLFYYYYYFTLQYCIGFATQILVSTNLVL